MAGYVALRDAIVTALGTVANIGDIYNYERFLTTKEAADTAFLNTIGTTPMIQYADVGWIGSDYRLSSSSSLTAWRYEVEQTFRIRLYRSWKDADASGRAFSVLLEDALEAVLSAMASLTPRVARAEARITANEGRVFSYPGQGDVLCHYGEVILSLPDQVTV